MARGVNKVIAIGNLGADPEVKYIATGQAVANFSLGVTEKWKDKASGEMKESTEWMRCECWGKQAEIAEQYLRKGALLYIEGSMRTDSWESDGVKKYMTKVRVNSFQMLGARGSAGEGQDRKPQVKVDDGQPFDDDIPF